MLWVIIIADILTDFAKQSCIREPELCVITFCGYSKYYQYIKSVIDRYYAVAAKIKALKTPRRWCCSCDHGVPT